MTYDVKTFELAEHFIGDGPKGSEAHRRCHQLAGDIQRYIEDWMNYDPRMNLEPFKRPVS